MGNPFWLVWCPAGKTPPCHRHETEELAAAEAMRLSENNAGHEFFVLQPVGVSYAVPPSAEYLALQDPVPAPAEAPNDAPLVPRRDRVLKNGEYERGDPVRYTGRCPIIARHQNIGAIGVVRVVRGAFIYVDFDCEAIDGPCYPENIEHESLKSFRVADRVKVGPDGLANARDAAGEKATVSMVVMPDKTVLVEFDHPIRTDDGDTLKSTSARFHEVDLIRPARMERV